MEILSRGFLLERKETSTIFENRKYFSFESHQEVPFLAGRREIWLGKSPKVGLGIFKEKKFHFV
jgi:hypothetical protein